VVLFSTHEHNRLEENKARILENSKYHEQFDTCELLNDVPDMAVTKKKNTVFRERAKRSASLSPNMLTGALLGSLNMVDKADSLDMDHVYVGFADFLWAFTFIGPCSFFLWKRVLSF
jgi:hypothetical protein